MSLSYFFLFFKINESLVSLTREKTENVRGMKLN